MWHTAGDTGDSEGTDMWRPLVDLQEKYSEAQLPLQPLQNGIPTTPYSPFTYIALGMGEGNAISLPLNPGRESTESQPHRHWCVTGKAAVFLKRR